MKSFFCFCMTVCYLQLELINRSGGGAGGGGSGSSVKAGTPVLPGCGHQLLIHRQEPSLSDSKLEEGVFSCHRQTTVKDGSKIVNFLPRAGRWTVLQEPRCSPGLISFFLA